MNSVVAFVIAVLIYPGALVAVVAALVLSWARGLARGAVAGEHATTPLATLSEWRGTLRDEAVAPGVHEILLTAAAASAVLAPLLALVLLPVPGNPLVAAIGLTGDLTAEAALLLVVPAMRLVIGWAVPSSTTRGAADTSARLLAGAVLPMALAVTVIAYQLDTLGLAGTPKTAPNAVGVAARVLAALTFAVVLPVLARTVGRRTGATGADDADTASAPADELAELAGRDLASFQIAEALQLAAAAAFFVAGFLLPIVPGLSKGAGYGVLWVAGVLLTAAGIGAWEGFAGKRGQASTETDRPPLTWWLGWQLLLALVALVASSWAVRGL
ncbi:MAG TPA: hypothetical protein VKQ30_12310 [Ktedonobacterales bacterium]|nr:hypothetical protein [Ktedonobacterales bacterium]